MTLETFISRVPKVELGLGPDLLREMQPIEESFRVC